MITFFVSVSDFCKCKQVLTEPKKNREWCGMLKQKTKPPVWNITQVNRLLTGDSIMIGYERITLKRLRHS